MYLQYLLPNFFRLCFSPLPRDRTRKYRTLFSQYDSIHDLRSNRAVDRQPDYGVIEVIARDTRPRRSLVLFFSLFHSVYHSESRMDRERIDVPCPVEKVHHDRAATIASIRVTCLHQ